MRILRWALAALALTFMSVASHGASNGSVTTAAGQSWTTVLSVDLNEEFAKLFGTPVLTIGNQTIWSNERGLAVAGCVSGTDGGAGSSYTIGLTAACIDAALLATDSVSADELNATGVESELEAVLDLADLQGDLALGTKTSGAFVGTVADGTGIDGTASGENSTYTPTLDLTELNSATWGAGSFTALTFDAGATDPVFTFGSGTFTMSALAQVNLDDEGEFRFFEEDAGGSNYIGFKAPAAITSNVTCTFENDGNPIPDSCVGDGVDDGAGGGITDVVQDTTPQLGGALDTNGNPIEFGTAQTDTSVVRSAAGQISVEGVAVPTISSTNTLTNKTIALGNNTVSGSASDFNTALTGADFYTSGGTDVPVADGGTGVSSLTAYAPIFGGTTGTGAVQSGTVGTAGQVLTSNGAGALPTFQAAVAGITLSAEQATTSGTSKDFAIPAGTKRITVMFSGVSVSGTSPLLVQLGDAGGVETTGYVSGASVASTSGTSTAGFLMQNVSTAAEAHSGKLILSLQKASTFNWVGISAIIRTDGFTYAGGGRKATSALTDTVRITTVNGSDTFDAGAVAVLTE